MNYLIVTDGIIENIIVADESFAESIGALPCYEGASMGAKYQVPDVQDETDALLVDMAYSIALLELGVM